MENRNVLIAIVLSSLVLLFWATFFQPPPVERKVDEQQISKNQEAESPSVDENQESVANEITRDKIISSTKRIKLESKISSLIEGNCGIGLGFGIIKF